MRKILFTLAACLLLATAAQAETLTIGDENIAYNVPGGYMAGDEEPYISVRSFLTEVSPNSADSGPLCEQGKPQKFWIR